MENFEISDLGKSVLGEKRLHYKVTGTMKNDMNDAYIKLLGKNDSFVVDFAADVRGKTLVRPSERNCLRIDLQELHVENVGGSEMKVANVQIQLNDHDRPSTIAQVHFQYGLVIPGDIVREAFKRSWENKKIIYVYKGPGTTKN